MAVRTTEIKMCHRKDEEKEPSSVIGLYVVWRGHIYIVLDDDDDDDTYVYALLQNLAKLEASLVFLVVGLGWAWASPNQTKCAVVMQFCACMLGVANPPPASLTGTHVRTLCQIYMGRSSSN